MSEVTIQQSVISVTIQQTSNSVEIVEISPASIDIAISQNIVEIAQPDTITVEVSKPSDITVELSNLTVIQPPPSVEAAKLVFESIANEDIAAFDMVRLVSDTNVGLTSDDTYANSKAIGIALEAKLTGETIRILTFGIVPLNPSFLFTINEPLFLSTSGAITNTPTVIVGEFVTQIGQGLGVGSIFINIEEPEEIL